MLSIERIHGIEFGAGDHFGFEPEFEGYESLKEAVDEAVKISHEKWLKLKAYDVGWTATVNGESKSSGKTLHLDWMSYIPCYGLCKIISIEIRGEQLDQLRVEYLDDTDGNVGHIDSFRKTVFLGQGTRPHHEIRSDDLKRVFTVTEAFNYAFERTHTSNIPILLQPQYWYAEQSKYIGKENALCRANSRDPDDRTAKKDLTKLRFDRFKAGKIYVVQTVGKGRNRERKDYGEDHIRGLQSGHE